jgi:hypothetical protein
MKNIQLSNIDYELLLAIAKAKRKKPNDIISDYLKKTYLELK